MRGKVTVIGSNTVATAATLLLAQRDIADLLLVDAGDDMAVDVLAAGAVLGFAPGVSAGRWQDAAGSDLVVLTAVTAEAPRELADRCPDAVLVVASPTAAQDVAAILSATHLPRGRVIGVAGEGGPLSTAARIERVVDTVLFDRRRQPGCGVLLRDQDTGAVALVDARLGARGVHEIL